MKQLMSSIIRFFRQTTCIIILSVYSTLFVSCSKDNVVNSFPAELFSNAYMSFHVGDIRQCYSPYSSYDTIYTVWKITGTTRRSDGTEVFIGEWYTGNLYPGNKRIEYAFIRDGFYYGTLLDSSSTYPTNPFEEEKLAEINPHDGDTWLHTAGVPDFEKEYMTAKYIGDLKTPAGIFKDVYNFQYDLMSIYYTKYFGYLGYSLENDSSSLFIVNYMKINGIEIGKYVEMAGPLNKEDNSDYVKNKTSLSPVGSDIK